MNPHPGGGGWGEEAVKLAYPIIRSQNSMLLKLIKDVDQDHT